MAQQLRDSGVASLGSVPWGTHVCHFYSTKADMVEVLVPYFAAGLRGNECCIWVCSDPLGVDEAVEALGKAVPGLDELLASGQMQVLPYSAWYLDADGEFKASQVLGRWKQKLSEAMAAGYAGLRVTGNTSWLDETAWRQFSEYEDRLYGVVGPDPMLAICSYPRGLEWTPCIMEVAQSHQYALFRRGTGWDVVACGKHREKEWEHLFDSIAEGVLITDERERILATNSKTLERFGVRSLSDLGGSLPALSRRFAFRSDCGGGPFTLLNVLRGGQGQGQYWRAFSRARQDDMDLRVSVRKMKSRSRFSTRYLVLFEDVTELRAAERAKDQFIQVMGHELRNPIQVMKAAIPLLETIEVAGDPALRRYVGILSGQLNHLSSLVEDLLTACRIDRQQLEINPRAEDLVDLVSEWMGSYAAPEEHPVVPLYSREVRMPVSADKVRIWEILDNLVGNAVKYSPAGKRISVDVQAQPGGALVRVEDEGIGIPEDEIAQVFGPFYRGTNAVRLGHDGTGLGLYISRQLARLHGGDLWVEGRPGGGTIVSLRLPLLRVEPTSCEPSAGCQPMSPVSSLSAHASGRRRRSTTAFTRRGSSALAE